MKEGIDNNEIKIRIETNQSKKGSGIMESPT